MANSEKINFNISPKLKKDIERLASWHGKSLSAFMLDICNTLAKANADRIKEQADHEKQLVNFGDVIATKTKKTMRPNNKKSAVNNEKAGGDSGEG